MVARTIKPSLKTATRSELVRTLQKGEASPICRKSFKDFLEQLGVGVQKISKPERVAQERRGT